MKPRLWMLVVALALWGCAMLGCGKKSPTQPNPPNPMTPDSVQDIFDASCARSGCHSGASPAGGQNLARGNSYAAIVNVASSSCAPMMRVRPFQPDSSCLVLRITGAVPPTMPIGGPLTPEQITTIRNWIQAGAPSEPPVVAAAGLFPGR